jgi:hypothetical protein
MLAHALAARWLDFSYQMQFKGQLTSVNHNYPQFDRPLEYGGILPHKSGINPSAESTIPKGCCAPPDVLIDRTALQFQK